MNNAVFEKLWKKSEKKDTLNLPQQQKQEKLFSVRTTKFFIENLLAIEMKKTQIYIKKPVYFGLSIL